VLLYIQKYREICKVGIVTVLSLLLGGLTYYIPIYIARKSMPTYSLTAGISDAATPLASSDIFGIFLPPSSSPILAPIRSFVVEVLQVVPARFEFGMNLFIGLSTLLAFIISV
jgi:hypothetical protein